MTSRARVAALFGLFWLAVSVIVTNGALTAHAQEFAKLYPSIVSVLPQWAARQGNRREPEGSGVIVFDGKWVLTADHVIGAAVRVFVRTHDGEILSASVAGRDRATDLALLKIDKALPPIRFGATPKIGSRACAIGNAFGLGLSLTCGIVSGVNKAGLGFNRVEDFIQTDTAVNPGASGGALIDGTGRMIGLLSAIFTKKSDANIGVNFAVSAKLAQSIARQLRDHGRVRRLFSGVTLGRYPAKGETGLEAALVLAVRNGSPAKLAGIEIGDRIVGAQDRRIRKPADFISVLAAMKHGGSMKMMIVRAGSDTRQQIKLHFQADRPARGNNIR